jgi:hypothetical protein
LSIGHFSLAFGISNAALGVVRWRGSAATNQLPGDMAPGSRIRQRVGDLGNTGRESPKSI